MCLLDRFRIGRGGCLPNIMKKYEVTFLNVPNRNKGTAWEAISDSEFETKIIEGSLEIQNGIATIYKYGVSKLIDPETNNGFPTKTVVFAAALSNVIIQAV